MWYLYKDEQQQGPLTWDELCHQAENGIIGPADLVWTDGMENWAKADRIEGLFAVTTPAPINSKGSLSSPVLTDQTSGSLICQNVNARKSGKRRLIVLLTVLVVLVMGGGFLAFNVFFINGEDGIFSGYGEAPTGLDNENLEAFDVDSLQTMTVEELDPIMRGDDWHLRLAAGASLVDREELAMTERLKLLLQALEYEMKNPAQGPIGPGAGYTPTEEYARMQLVHCLSALGPEAVPELSRAADKASLQAVDYIRIALLKMGDEEARDPARELLARSTNPWLRTAAAEALGHAGDREAVSLLKEALQDPFMTTSRSCIQEIDYYPVRESAAAALRALGVGVKRRGNGIFEIGE